MKAVGSLASFVHDAFGRRVGLAKNGLAPIFYIYSGKFYSLPRRSGDDVVQVQAHDRHNRRLVKQRLTLCNTPKSGDE
jgi:hypothetical protein